LWEVNAIDQIGFGGKPNLPSNIFTRRLEIAVQQEQFPSQMPAFGAIGVVIRNEESEIFILIPEYDQNFR
jgi:hypothetical protein